MKLFNSVYEPTPNNYGNGQDIARDQIQRGWQKRNADSLRMANPMARPAQRSNLRKNKLLSKLMGV